MVLEIQISDNTLEKVILDVYVIILDEIHLDYQNYNNILRPTLG